MHTYYRYCTVVHYEFKLSIFFLQVYVSLAYAVTRRTFCQEVVGFEPSWHEFFSFTLFISLFVAIVELYPSKLRLLE